MQKMPITLIAILLFVQILSNGFAQIPNTSDEETLEVDLEMPSQASARSNHTGGNGTGGNGTGGNGTGGNGTGGNGTGGNTGCGYDANYSSVYAVVYYYQFVNQTIPVSMSVNCEVSNSSMFMNYWIYDSNNYTMAGSNQSWTGSNHSNFNWTTPSLSLGNYTFHTDLYVNGTWVDSDALSFIVMSNSTGGNGTGGNGTGTHNDAHCLIVNNLTISPTYYVTIDLENTCSKDINYPGINATADHSGVSGFSNQTSWWYGLWANSTYNMSWQLSFDSSVQNGTNITLDFEAVILNCGANGTWHDCPSSTLSYQFIFAGNNTGGNNTGGNNTGGNNTGGNNTGGNNTGGNNTGGNNTGGNNTGGNNTGSNNTGNNNGSSTVDSDNDGVVDSADLCPSTIVGSQVNANGCAPSQLDSDSDGIVDSFDLCPSTSAGTVVDQTGCAYSTGGNSSGNNSGSTSGGSSDSSDSESGGLPSIGVVGTIAAIGVGLIFTARREDEE